MFFSGTVVLMFSTGTSALMFSAQVHVYSPGTSVLSRYTCTLQVHVYSSGTRALSGYVCTFQVYLYLYVMFSVYNCILELLSVGVLCNIYEAMVLVQCVNLSCAVSDYLNSLLDALSYATILLRF
jgi:hypothetical protein